MQDDFLNQKRTEVLGKMLAAYTVSGGKLKKGQLDAIAMSSYGKEAVSLMGGEKTTHRARISQSVEAGFSKGVPPDLRERMIEGAPSWLATKTTLQILLSPMRLLRPGAIGMGRLIGAIDVTE